MNRTSEQVRYPFAVVAGVAAAALLSVWGSLAYFGFESVYQRQSADPYRISAQFIRLDPVRAVVPESAVMGYLSDASGTVDSAMFLGAQYVLASRLLVRGAGQEWVLGNFTRPADYAEIGRAHQVSVHQDFGNGVVLFRRVNR